MVKCPKCGLLVKGRQRHAPHIHDKCFIMLINKQKEGTLDDIFNIQPEEVKENEEENV